MKKHPFWYYLLMSPIGYCSHELSVMVGLVILVFLYSLQSFQYSWMALLIPVAAAYIVVIVLFPRVSNNMIYCRYRHTLHMNIRFIWRYWKLDYLNNRQEVEKLLNKEFIEGLERLSIRIKPKKFTVETHGWIYWNIKDHPKCDNSIM